MATIEHTPWEGPNYEKGGIKGQELLPKVVDQVRE
jgi:hypothetical protein